MYYSSVPWVGRQIEHQVPLVVTCPPTCKEKEYEQKMALSLLESRKENGTVRDREELFVEIQQIFGYL